MGPLESQNLTGVGRKYELVQRRWEVRTEVHLKEVLPSTQLVSDGLEKCKTGLRLCNKIDHTSSTPTVILLV